ncbi:MAG: hypothetical protein GX649_03255, partial [Chloroflexi bacterium]|nr:hypothetical protein [Chloroflexota bacterium]
AGRTTYTVTVHAGVVDIFGQTLEEDVSLDVRVGAAYPLFTVPGEQFVVLDPAAAPGLSMYSVNYGAARVRAYAVEPEDWPAYTAYLRSVARDRTQDMPPGDRVMDERVTIDGRPDEVTETIIDLSPLRGQGHRHLVLVIEPEVGLIASLRGQTPPIARVWVQMSDLAVDAMTDSEEMVAWATSLAEGVALEGVSLTLYPGGETAETGPDGLTRLPLVGSASGEGAGYVIARRGSDAALLPENAWIWGGTSWQKRAPDTNYRWYVWDDRGMYRPGEDVHVKGWVRRVEFERGADRLTLPGAGQVAWDLIDPRGSTIASGTAELSALGGFDWSVTLPEGMNLGHAYFQMRLTSAGGRTDYGHAIQVQEFRRPEFEVTATASEGPYFVGDAAVTTVSAAYYAGGPLPGADVHWMVTAEPGTYRPPNWDDFDFGYWVPWWLPGPSAYRWPGGREVRVEHYDALTDAAGEHALRIGFESVDPVRPSVVTAEASVMDVNRQAWAASANMLVHPADLYVGLRSEPTFVERGTPIRVDAIVTDLDGNAVTGRLITVRSVRLQWEYARGEWQEVEVDEQICSVTSADEPVRCTFETPEGGTYRITASIADDEDRRNETQITRWVSGGQRPSANRVELEDVTLIPDRQEYAPGDTAQILVQAPFAPAEGLLTVRRLGLVHTERFTMDEPSITLGVPIDEDDIPNVTVQVDLVGTAPRQNAAGEPDEDLPARPAYATGSLDLRVPAYSRTLSVALAPREAELEPGGETVIDLQVRDAEGEPVSDAEVAVI